MPVRTCDDVEDDAMRVSDVEFAGRVRPNRHERTSGGLEPSEGGGPIGDVEGGDDCIMRWDGVAQEVEPEGAAGECDAIRRAIHHRAAKDGRVRTPRPHSDLPRGARSSLLPENVIVGDRHLLRK